MYSLYRAWLMHQDAFNSTIGGTPPDVLLQVGPTATQFTAHRAILIAHSGYFKSVLSQAQTSVNVTNIGVSEFTSLLTWMYTGFLDLNFENIYNILLATHLLHMPSALEICRNFLIQNNHLLHGNNPEQNRPSYNLQNNIIKPIPSRKFLPNTFRFEPIIPVQNTPAIKLNNENTSFQKIDPIKKIIHDNEIRPSAPMNNNDRIDDDEDSHHTTSSTISSEKIIEIVQVTNSPKPSTSFQRHTPTPDNQNCVSPHLSDKQTLDDDAVIHYTTKRSSKKMKKTLTSPTENEKVIIDIACCDGPVRFHRVLNNSYGLTSTNNENTTKPYHLEKSAKTDIMNKIMNANINLKKMHHKNEENSPGGTQSDTEIIYTCVYCNHTFKSQYCYQKHARRHINPITLNSTCKILLNDISPSAANTNTLDTGLDPHSSTITTSTINDTASIGGSATPGKREVKLLDMNVQYYPCKTCGSKFPSYYFVHKHRKMYHAEEMLAEKEAENNGKKSPMPKENDG